MSVDTAGPRVHRCACGNVIGPLDRWCSHACFRAETVDGPDDTPDAFVMAGPDEEGPFG